MLSITFILLTDGEATITRVESVEHSRQPVHKDDLATARQVREDLALLGVELKRADILPEFYKRLAAVKAQLFCIGIGKDHDQKALEKIVKDRPASIEGKYFNLTHEQIYLLEKLPVLLS